jgi:predicted DNA-binding transcriptional regulator YafY
VPRPTARVLQLLELLQAGGTRTVGDLAARLGVDERTVRRYVDHLVELDVPVETVRGRYGGVRLGAGSRLPPLMLTDEEAVAAVLGLARTARDGPSAPTRTAAETAAAKIRRVLPAGLADRVAGLPHATSTAPSREPVGADAEILLTATTAVRDGRPLLLTQRRRDGSLVERTLLPDGVVEHEGRWYVTGLDSRADAVRTFRLDRLAAARIGTGRFPPRAGADPVQQVLGALAAVPRDFTVRVRVRAPLERLRRRLPASVADVAPLDDGWHLVVLEAARLDWVAAELAALDAPFVVEQPEALLREVRALAARLAQRAGA